MSAPNAQSKQPAKKLSAQGAELFQTQPANGRTTLPPKARVFKILIIFMSKLSQKWMSN